jgi:tRNA pseudouridine55 synthase
MAQFERMDAATDPRFGCRPADRSVAEYVRWGAILLDKPSGPTSRSAAEAAGRAVGARRVGHGGTLDPKVTGVLPLLLGRCTPVADILLGCDKTYAGAMMLHGDVDDSALHAAMAASVGTVTQTPPVRSAVKRAPRQRWVYRWDVTERDGRRVAFIVRCQGGTYIRTLCHELGKALGCGAHMAELRRTESGPFKLDDCTTMDAIEQSVDPRRVVRPVEEIVLRVLPGIWMSDGAVQSVCSGYPLAAPGICRTDDFRTDERVALLTLKGELVGLGRALMSAGDAMNAERGLVARPQRVLMPPETYPKWKGAK